MYSQTKAALKEFDNQHDFERMCADILIALGYRDVVLIAPQGGSDGGMDITFTTETGGKGLACVTLRKDIEDKFKEDFKQRQAGEFEKYYFFCNSYLTASQKLKFATYCLNTLRAEIIPQDIEALRGLLDSALTSIRAHYLHIKDERLPDLKFGFFENGQIVEQITRPIKNSWYWQTVDTYVKRNLTRKREELTYMLTGVDSAVPESKIEQFRKKYEKYLAELEPALKMQFIKSHMPYCKLEFMILNEGKAPAHGVDVRVTFPHGASIIKIDSLEDEVDIDDQVPDEPSHPEWAQPPIPDWMSGMAASLAFTTKALSYISPSAYTSAYPSPFHKEIYNSTNFPFGKNVLNRKKEKVTHRREWFFDPIAIYLPLTTQEECIVTYEIVADEFPEPITGEVKIVWNQNDTSG